MTSTRSRTLRKRSGRLVLLAGVVLISACQSDGMPSAAAARAIEQVSWDADEVTRLTGLLAEQTKGLHQSVRLDPTIQQRLRMQNKTAIRLMDLLRRLDSSTKQLALRVEKGGGLEETVSVVRKIGSQLRSARVEARSLMLGHSSLVWVEQARETLRALSPFYGTQLDPAESNA